MIRRFLNFASVALVSSGIVGVLYLGLAMLIMKLDCGPSPLPDSTPVIRVERACPEGYTLRVGTLLLAHKKLVFEACLINRWETVGYAELVNSKNPQEGGFTVYYDPVRRNFFWGSAESIASEEQATWLSSERVACMHSNGSWERR